MATKYTTIRSQFTPITYDEYMKPLVEMTQEHNELEKNYMALDSQAALIDSIANEQTDPESYAKYKRYSAELQAHADNLLRNGLTPSSRSSLYRMSTRYNTEIQPIFTANENRNKQIEKYQELMAKDNTAIIQRDPSTISLDEFVANPTTSFGNVVSGQQLASFASSMAEKLAKADQDPYSPGDFRKVMGDQYWSIMNQLGYTPEQLDAVIDDWKNGEDAVNVIQRLVLGGSGILGWGNDAQINQAADWVKLGVHSAIGTTQRDLQKNLEYMDPYTRWKTGQSSDSGSSLPTTTPFTRSSTRFKLDDKELKSLQKDKEFINELADYIPSFIDQRTNGKYELDIDSNKNNSYLKKFNEYATRYGLLDDNGEPLNLTDITKVTPEMIEDISTYIDTDIARSGRDYDRFSFNVYDTENLWNSMVKQMSGSLNSGEMGKRDIKNNGLVYRIENGKAIKLGKKEKNNPQESLDEFFSTKPEDISWDPVENQFYVRNKNGTYRVDPSFFDELASINDGTVSDILRNASENYRTLVINDILNENGPDRNGRYRIGTSSLTDPISTAFRAMIYSSNAAIPSASHTSTKSQQGGMDDETRALIRDLYYGVD